MARKTHVQTTINGEQTEFLCHPHQSLSEVLRDELHMTGTKEGCTTGDCGACSVLLDGRLVCGCLVLALEAEGTEITTIEGMASGEKLHPLQQKFLEHAALQCGICTPGMIVMTRAWLAQCAQRGDPIDEASARKALAGNLCRCTGYGKILASALAASKEPRR